MYLVAFLKGSIKKQEAITIDACKCHKQTGKFPLPSSSFFPIAFNFTNSNY